MEGGRACVHRVPVDGADDLREKGVEGHGRPVEGRGRAWRITGGHGRSWKGMEGHGRPWKVTEGRGRAVRG